MQDTTTRHEECDNPAQYVARAWATRLEQGRRVPGRHPRGRDQQRDPTADGCTFPSRLASELSLTPLSFLREPSVPPHHSRSPSLSPTWRSASTQWRGRTVSRKRGRPFRTPLHPALSSRSPMQAEQSTSTRWTCSSRTKRCSWTTKTTFPRGPVHPGRVLDRASRSIAVVQACTAEPRIRARA